MADRYHGYDTKVYTAQIAGHAVELEFDKKLLILNRAKLIVDGEVVDTAQVVYGDETLTTELADGTQIEVAFKSGAVGQLTRAQARQADGSWVDLQEKPDAA